MNTLRDNNTEGCFPLASIDRLIIVKPDIEDGLVDKCWLTYCLMVSSEAASEGKSLTVNCCCNG